MSASVRIKGRYGSTDHTGWVILSGYLSTTVALAMNNLFCHPCVRWSVLSLSVWVNPLGVHAQDKTQSLRASTWVPAQHALNPAVQSWIDSLKKASGGSINPTLFPSEQLGKAMDHYDMARDGLTDFAFVNPGYQPGRFPIFAAASLPFEISNAKAGSAAIDAWYRTYAAKEMKDVKYCFAFAHDPGALHSRKKVVMPADLKGLPH